MQNNQKLPISSSPRPQTRQSPTPQTGISSLDGTLLTQRAFLSTYTSDDFLNMCLNDDTADDHLTKDCVQSLVAENQIQFTDVLEHAVQTLDEDLDQIDQSQWRFGGGGDHDERQGCVGAVCNLGGGVGGAGGGGAGALGEKGRKREEVTGAWWTLRYQAIDLRDERLLGLRVLVGLSWGIPVCAEVGHTS